MHPAYHVLSAIKSSPLIVLYYPLLKLSYENNIRPWPDGPGL